MRWIVSEIYQEFSGVSDEVSASVVSQVNERLVEVIWRSGDIARVLDTSLKLDDQLLILLFSHGGIASEEFLVASTESSVAYARRRLKHLHADRLVEYSIEASNCALTPMGSKRAEEILRTSVVA